MAGDAYASIKIVKSSYFRGDTAHLWSNRYHFRDGAPADATHWETFRAAVVNAEKLIFTSGCHIVGAVGYESGSDVPVFSWSGSVAGTSTDSGLPPQSEVCALGRYGTTARSTKNHPIYLFNYWHEINSQTANHSMVSATQKTAIEAYMDAWIAGFSDGTNTYHRCGPNGASAVSRLVDPYLRIHSFPI